jgi:hypothetical protein
MPLLLALLIANAVAFTLVLDLSKSPAETVGRLAPEACDERPSMFRANGDLLR